MSGDPYSAGPYGTNFDTGVSYGMTASQHRDRQAKHRRWLDIKAREGKQAGAAEPNTDSPLRRERSQQEAVRRCHKLNPELTMKDLGARFRITGQKAKRLLTEGPVFPKAYKIAARRLRAHFPGKTHHEILELVTEHKESGRQWCSVCRSWDDSGQFSEGASVTRRHKRKRCRDLASQKAP